VLKGPTEEFDDPEIVKEFIALKKLYEDLLIHLNPILKIPFPMRPTTLE
jgi:hypothetical protein